MIDNTIELADGPLYTNLFDALNAPGAVYIHVKKGHVYRRIGGGLYAGEIAADVLEGHDIAIYEHLFPDAHAIYLRPQSEFVEVIRTPKGEHRRFEFVVNETITVIEG